MHMKMIGSFLAAVLLTIWFGGGAASAQDKDEYRYTLGRWNVWTTEEVLFQKTGYSPELKKIRFGRHKNFDRVVFEMEGDFLGYYISYQKPPFQGEASEEETKVRGKAFVQIGLYPISASEENIKFAEKFTARSQLVKDVQMYEWFEGELGYVFGLNKRTPYRVQVLSRPTRLVVDFKH